MKFVNIGLSLALAATSVSALAATYKTSLDAADVTSVLTQLYLTLPTVAPAVSTSIASELYSLETSWADTPAATSLAWAILDMPEDAQNSLLTATNTAEIATAAYFTTNIPAPLRTEFFSYYAAIESVKAKATSKSSANAAGPRQTGMAVMGAVGVVGGVLAVM